MHERVALSAVIFSDNRSSVIGVKRSDDPEDIFARLWGIPAITLRQDEGEFEGIARIGWQKLGTVIQTERFVGEKSAERPGNMILRMRLWECIMNEEPDFSKRDLTEQGISQYITWRWMAPDELIITAQKGSLCTQLLLASQGIIYERSH